MLRRLAVYSFIEVFLLLILFHCIACDEGVHCKVPPMIPHSIVKEIKDGDYFRPYDEVEILCEPGYRYNGKSRFILCQKDGAWDYEFGECIGFRIPQRPHKPQIVVKCVDAPVVENARYEIHSGVNNFPTLGSFVVYSCKTGFQLNNTKASTLHCVLDPKANNARWKGEIPVCIEEKKSCPDPGVSKHGSRKGDCCFSGDVLQFSCEEGYELVGNSEIKCLEGGEWSSGRPLCRQKESCADPGVSKHGSREGDCCFSGDVLQFSCEEGYKLVGNSEIKCLEGGEWSSGRPLCKLSTERESCPDPGVSKHGSRKGDCCFSGDVLQFSCKKGYELVGNSEIKCLQGGGWSSGRPLCKHEGVHCKVPPVIPHSVVIENKDGDYFRPYDEVEILCKPGYRYNGTSRIITCNKEGAWEYEFGECIGLGIPQSRHEPRIEVKCADAPVVENARYEIHSGVNNFPTIGSFVVYSCKTGFQLNNTNASTLHCVLDPKGNCAGWKGEIPVCIEEKKSCPDPGVSKHGSRKGDCCSFGDVLQFSCQEGYELVGNCEIKCLQGGGWSSGRPLCKPEGVHCELPPVIPHSVVKENKDGDYFRPHDEVEILCKPGYRYNGTSRFIKCENDSEWDYEFGECIEIFCDAPEPLANGRIPELLTTNQTIFPYAFALTYICDDGYRLLGGDSWRICENGIWSGKTPHCEPVFCPDPGIPENGDRIGSTFQVGAKVRFKCFTGYDLIGSQERYCKPNGQWTGELSRCDTPTNYCPNPGIPINGKKNSTSYDMGDKVGFHCHNGYIRIGSEVRECLPNRTWSGSEAFCLGPYDFDNSAEVRDALKAQLLPYVEQYGKILDINYPGRLILYFVFDSSGSVGLHNFKKSVEFAKAIVKRVGISENGTRAGALAFSSKAENMFLPLDYSTTDDVLRALGRINYTGGGSAVAAALRLVREENIPLVEGNIKEKDIKYAIFILTDGKANMGGSPEVEAEILKNDGVEIYCIGITGSIEKEPLYKIASTSTGPQGEYLNVYILQNYATMSWLVQEITNGTIDYSECGLGMENVGVIKKARIFGGKTSVEPWPWMAALYIPLEKSSIPDTLQCGGSIIHRNFILTAAHCLYDAEYNVRNKREIIIKLGLTDVKNETYVQELEVLKMIIHPKYRPGPNYDYDIALLEVDKPIGFNAFVRPICLPPVELPADSTLYSSEEFGWATGWGHQGEIPKNSKGSVTLKSSQILKELQLPIHTRERCTQNLVYNRVDLKYFSDRMFCAGDGKNDTCKGDSGGPLMQSGLNADGYLYWTQIGIVSWGIGCGQAYGFYTHVQKFVPWINNMINSREELI